MEPSGQFEIRRLKIERELKLREFEAREKELEAQQRKEEFEARKEELEAQRRKEELEARKEELTLKHEREMRALKLNARKIAHFERVAQNLKWPTDQWPLLLQSVLKGKAQEAYTALPISECVDYNCVKNAILKAYELVPEAYRQKCDDYNCVKNAILKAYELVPEYHQKFRNYRKQESQTHVEFGHEKEVYFDKWCNFREVGTDFEKLREVILIEEFKRCVCDDIKTYIDEHKVENLEKAPAYADDYALTHKSTFNKNRSVGSTKRSYPEVGQKSENVTPEKSSDKGQTSNQIMNKDRKLRSFAPMCHYCKNLGMLCLTVGS